MTQPSNALYHGDVSGPQEALSLRLSALRQEKDWCNRNGYPDVPSVDEAISVVEAMSGEMDKRIEECISALIEEWMASDSEDVRDIAESLKDEDWPSLAV